MRSWEKEARIKILVPLDGSFRAEKILVHVEEMALRFKAKVIFLQVVNPFVPVMDSYTDLLEQSMEEIKRQTEKSKSYLSAWRANFRKKGIHSRKIVEQGPVVDPGSGSRLGSPAFSGQAQKCYRFLPSNATIKSVRTWTASSGTAL